VKWVYNGIDLDAYPYKAEKGDRLIFVGRFVSFKCPHVAIEVAKRLGMGLDLVGGAYEEPFNHLDLGGEEATGSPDLSFSLPTRHSPCLPPRSQT